MEERNVERLLGHSGNWSNAAYDRPLEDWFIEDYLKAVPALTIYKQTAAATVEQTQTLMMQMESKGAELQGLKERMDKMGEIMMDLDNGLRSLRVEFESEESI
jgi:hypothetical protein